MTEEKFTYNIKEGKLNLDLKKKQIEKEIISLPEKFLIWQSKTRISMFEKLKEMGSGAVKAQPAHLPVVATFKEDLFPINIASRGIGILPREDLLEEFTTKFKEVIENPHKENWKESLHERVMVADEFYSDWNNFNKHLLGGLEIFEGNTYKNLQNYPLASLLYTGEAPDFLSYQFNCFVETISSGNKYYGFLKAARELFAFDAFHVPQTSYPFGYIYYTLEIIDKTPYPRGKEEV